MVDVNIEQLREARMKSEMCVEASDLALPAGEWPEEIVVVDGNARFSFSRFAYQMYGPAWERELGAVVYMCSFGWRVLKLTVLND